MLSTHTRVRPKKARSDRLEARINKEQKALFERAAALQGRTLTDFVVDSAREAAVRTIQEYETVSLTRKDQEAFVLGGDSSTETMTTWTILI